MPALVVAFMPIRQQHSTRNSKRYQPIQLLFMPPVLLKWLCNPFGQYPAIDHHHLQGHLHHHSHHDHELHHQEAFGASISTLRSQMSSRALMLSSIAPSDDFYEGWDDQVNINSYALSNEIRLGSAHNPHKTDCIQPCH